MSALDRILLWAKEKDFVFATQAGGHPDDYLDELLPFFDDLIEEGCRLRRRNELFMKYVIKAHQQIPTNSNAYLIFNKLFLELSKSDTGDKDAF